MERVQVGLFTSSDYGENRMGELFGRQFYEWWSGLSRISRLVTALVIIALAGITAWAFTSAWLLWVPALVTGCILLLLS